MHHDSSTGDIRARGCEGGGDQAREALAPSYVRNSRQFGGPGLID